MKRILIVSIGFLLLITTKAYSNEIGGYGLEHTTDAFVSLPGFYELGGLGYANTSNLLSPSNTFQTLNSHIALGYASVIKGLDLGLNLYQSTFALDKNVYHDNGDLCLNIKYAYDFSNLISAGVLIQPRFLSGVNGFGFKTSATSYLGLLLLSFNLTDLSKFTPLFFHINLGYYIDNSINLLDTSYTYSIDGLYGLGIRGDNRIIGDIAVEAVLLKKLLHPFIEFYTEQSSTYEYYKASLPSLSNASFSQNPVYVTPGIKLVFPNRLYVLAAFDIGLMNKSSFITTTAYTAVPWSSYIELGYKILPCKPVIIREQAPKPMPVTSAVHPAIKPEAPTPAPLIRKKLKYAYIEKFGKRIIITQAIHFKLNSSVIMKDSYVVLNDVATLIKDNPSIRVRIGGYTDNIGSPEYNLALSKSRAESVMKYIIGRGVSPDSLTAKGFGEASPIASNKTPIGRAENRRVEFKIIKR